MLQICKYTRYNRRVLHIFRAFANSCRQANKKIAFTGRVEMGKPRGLDQPPTLTNMNTQAPRFTT